MIPFLIRIYTCLLCDPFMNCSHLSRRQLLILFSSALHDRPGSMLTEGFRSEMCCISCNNQWNSDIRIKFPWVAKRWQCSSETSFAISHWPAVAVNFVTPPPTQRPGRQQWRDGAVMPSPVEDHVRIAGIEEWLQDNWLHLSLPKRLVDSLPV